MATVIIGLGVFSILDPSNVFIAPQSGPLLIGLLYFVSIVCYASNGIAVSVSQTHLCANADPRFSSTQLVTSEEELQLPSSGAEEPSLQTAPTRPWPR